jgi:pantothenate kinase
MDEKMWQRMCQTRLTLDRTDVPLELERGQVEQYYQPVSRTLIAQASGRKRFLAAVAGPPGSGKTAFAAILVAVINAEIDRQEATMVQLDGWHYSNDYLSTHSLQRDGAEVILRQIKGAPETYNAVSALECFEKIKAGGEVRYPVYSRQIHDPIPNGGCVERQHRIVIVEGNYLLLQEEPWQHFRELFDICIFLTAPPEALVKGLRQRHLRGGKSASAADEQIRTVDLPNVERVLKNSGGADIVVKKANSQHIIGLVYLPSPDRH